MQLKYPTFPGRLSTFQASDMYKRHSYIATDYAHEMHSLSDARALAAVDRVIQFPFVAPASDEKSAEELQHQLEKRQESGRRLQEQAAKQRADRMARQEEELAVFSELQASKPNIRKADFEVSS